MSEFKRMLEDTKKEVREIRALESQMKWNMQREERKEVQLVKSAEEVEVRDWRWKQNEGMRALLEEKARDDKVTALAESKDFQEFKRERRAKAKDEDLRYIQEVYQQDLEHATLRLEVAREQAELEQEALAGRFETRMHLKEEKLRERQTVRMQAEEERLVDQTLEMQALADQLAREKAALMQSLELTKAATRAPTRGAASSGRTSVAGRGRA